MAKTSFSAPVEPPKAVSLLAWYRKNGRDLPWRSHNGRAPSPYHTWLSEIMLQQTGVVTVIPYYLKFTARWPKVENLAAADEDEVMQEWAGLGYYSRARNLLKCAREVATHYKGQFPSELHELKSLPGIGEYTANAVRAIAFDLPANVVDGNVERVVSRIFAFQEPLNIPANKMKIRTMAASLAPAKHAGDYAQGLMDLGATICTPRNPLCHSCPWQKNCQAFATGQTQTIPVIQRRAKLPEREAHIFVMIDKQGNMLLRKRPPHGLLGGLWEFPSTEWLEKDKAGKAVFPFGLKSKDFTLLPKPVTHVFTHFKLTLHVHVARAMTPKPKGDWFAPDALPALPTLMKKVMAATS